MSSYKLILTIFIGFIVVGFSGCSKQELVIEKKHYYDYYPYKVKDTKIGNYTLRRGYNIITVLNNTKKNLDKLKSALSEVQKKLDVDKSFYSPIDKPNLLTLISGTKVPKYSFKNDIKLLSDRILMYKANNKLSVRYYLKADDENIYLVEDIGFLRKNLKFPHSLFILHNKMIDILKEMNLSTKKENVEVDFKFITDNFKKLN